LSYILGNVIEVFKKSHLFELKIFFLTFIFLNSAINFVLYNTFNLIVIILRHGFRWLLFRIVWTFFILHHNLPLKFDINLYVLFNLFEFIEVSFGDKVIDTQVSTNIILKILLVATPLEVRRNIIHKCWVSIKIWYPSLLTSGTFIRNGAEYFL
jgi:hypothetical protein